MVNATIAIHAQSSMVFSINDAKNGIHTSHGRMGDVIPPVLMIQKVRQKLHIKRKVLAIIEIFSLVLNNSMHPKSKILVTVMVKPPEL